jgi:hypothetical protein
MRGAGSIVWILLLTIEMWFAISGKSNAQDVPPHSLVKSGLVYLKATGTGAPDAGPIAGVKRDSTGTGFLVTDDGFVLTTYHLISELGKVMPETIELSANIGAKATNPETPVAIVSWATEFDLLLLKISPPVAGKYESLRLGTFEDAKNVSKVFTNGFPESENDRPLDGTIVSRNTKSGFLWSLNNMPFDFGQSGSPIYNDLGMVVGIAKGQSSDASGISYMIPIQFADSLLSTIRLSEMQKQINQLKKSNESLAKKLAEIETVKVNPAVENIKEIASNFEWSANTTGDDIRVAYQKLANTGPQIKSMTVRATPLARGESGPVIMFTLVAKRGDGPEADILPLDAYDRDKRRGVTTAGGLFARVKKNFCEADDAEEINRIKIDITPSLENGRKLDPETIFLEEALNKKTNCNAGS